MFGKLIRHAFIGLILASPLLAFAGVTCRSPSICDDFTQSTDTNDWVAQYDACLTAGTASNNTTSTSKIPGCNYSSPDAAGSGALRLTASSNSAHGAIVSNYTFPSSQGLQVTFTTYAYGGDSGGPASDGADGMSFFLQDGSVGTTVGSTTNLGSWGGSLAYSCSNANSPYVGLTGAYLGLGIDEYGNFLNGGSSHDNTASAIANQTSSSSTNGYNNFTSGTSQQANRIGLRGAGNISWYWLNRNYPAYYPSTLSSSNQQAAVQNTCKTGYLWDYGTSFSQNITSISQSGTTLTIRVPDASTYSNGDTMTIGGTINDVTSAKSITAASVSGTMLTLTVANHGYSNGDPVDIEGVTSNPVNATITDLTETCTSRCSRSGSIYTYTFTANNSFSNGDRVTISSTGLTTTGATVAGNTYFVSNVTSTTFDVTGQSDFGTRTVRSSSPRPTATDITQAPTIPGVYTISGVTSSTFQVTLSSTPAGITRSSATATLQPPAIPGNYSISNVNTTNNTFDITLPSTPGTVTNVSGTAIDASQNASPVQTTTAVLDYPAIPGGYYVLPASQLLANEGVSDSRPPSTSRDDATTNPITYRLRITPAGLLSLYYSYNGSAYQTVISNFAITTNNGPLPATFRFGFAGSTGGSRNAHEISCFLAEPTQSSSSANANTVQSGQVRTGTQLYLASYDPNDWSGTIISSPLTTDSSGNVTVGTTADWDADCALTGGTCKTTLVSGQTSTAKSPSSRVLLTWDGTQGIPLEWTNLTTAQQTLLNSSDSNGQNRLNWLRGDRSKEQTATPAGPLRVRGGVLGDIVDSSPTWVGYPTFNYADNFPDLLYPAATAPESSYKTNYASGSAATRTNVVYAGSNDGMMHGFRTGSFDASQNYVSTNNDGAEVIAFMPASVLATPGASPAADVVGLTSPTYGHNYFVDAPPGIGDLYYNSAWHTWLVGTLGAGGKEAYALDITDPSRFSETNASTLVMGDWTASSLTSCVNATTSCGNNLGYSSGLPLIRRLHNGKWAIIFGNGLSSINGHAGVFIGIVSPTNGSVAFTWLDTGSGSSTSPNGINSVASADLDADHIADYLYAGDLQGNVWRFDLTSQNPTLWGVSNYGTSGVPAVVAPTSGSVTPLYIAKDGAGNVQPITTRIGVTATYAGGNMRVILGFGTGQGIPFTATRSEYYAPNTQTVYGIWDWEMSKWSTSYLSRTGTNPYTRSNLSQVSLVTGSASGTREFRVNTVCWKDSTNCATTPTDLNTQYGWYFDLPDSVSSSACSGTTCNEQVIYNPIVAGGELVLNTTLAAANTVGQCTPSLPTGWTMAFSMDNGGAPNLSRPQNVFANPVTQSFSPRATGVSITGVQNNGVGTPWVVAVGSQQVMISQTSSGQAATAKYNPQGGVKVSTTTWEQLR